MILVVSNRLWIRWLPFYLVMGVITWTCVLGSGIHATIAGVIVAMLVPARGKYNIILFINKTKRILANMHTHRDIDGYWYSIFIKPEHLNSVHEIETACHNVETPLQRLEHALLPLVLFVILPLFAFFNAGLPMQDIPVASAFAHPVTLGCFLGLLFGKPAGIGLASYLAVRSCVAALPANVRWPHIIGAGMLGGIGFTMSLFISGLSFVDAQFLHYAKFGVFCGSLSAALIGLGFLSALTWRNSGGYEEA